MRKFFQGLRKEISFVLLLKVLFILGLWWICFSHPVQKHITPQVMQQHLLD
jgi:hypothetical protein